MEHFKTIRSWNHFNHVYAGRQALTYIDSNKYYTGTLNGKGIKAHRVIWKLVYGTDPYDILHENGNTLDNRIEKLSAGTDSDNSKDKKKPKNNSSGCVGVGWNDRDSCWHSRIGVNGRLKHIGYFNNLEDAIAARKAAEVKFGYHPNHGKR